MKLSILLVSSVCLLLASGPAARAQLSAELLRFQEATGDRSILFRGKEAPRYNFPFNGNPYWENATFRTGDLVCEGKFYHGLSLNVNAQKQLVLVRMDSSPQAIALSPSQVPSFTIDGRRYVGVGPGDVLPEGIYAIIGDGPEQIYKHVEKRLNFNTESVNGDPIGYYDPDYRYDVTRYFYIQRTYYFRDAEGHFSRFKNLRSLLRKFPGRRREIRRTLDQMLPATPEISFDTYCELVLDIASR